MHKKYLSVFLFLLTVVLANAQYLTKSFTYGGVTRQYILYVPAIYDGTQPVPFVVALHGLGDNMNNFKNINLKAVADTANFIVAFPQALVDGLTNSTAWNSGAGAFGVTLNANVDDVGFLYALMDTVSANYNINQKRIYATGFSMGGFMTNRLACQLNNRVAAIASVSGTIGNGLNCQPNHAVPAAHFHGTADGTVAYSGNQYGKDAEVLVKYWVTNNGCDTTAIIDSLPDTKNDGKAIIHYRYPNGSYNTEVEFYKVIGGAHEWLTAANDLTYSVAIWRFFNRFEWTEQNTGIKPADSAVNMNVFPNPNNGLLHVQLTEGANNGTLQLYNAAGMLMLQQTITQTADIVTKGLAPGCYVLKLNTASGSTFTKVVIQ